ncbi:hypothetical protein BDY24DRAFT_397515 [Mrakia frigida]|uniref:uncharacterized protein n=1 Tax=Mrakia frigida TaxID=29902 RepID=UPI003FCC1D60
MAPLNYSKWDNLDLNDSDDEQPSAPLPPQPTASSSTASSSSSSSSSKAKPLSPPSPPSLLSPANPAQPPGKVAAVWIPCIGQRTGDLFLPKLIDDNHPIFSEGESSPLSKLVGMEILVWREEKRDYREIGHSPPHDNQSTTYMMINPSDGFAPPRWQSGVGSVIVARVDKKPLARNHIEALWMLADGVLDQFGNGPLSNYNKQRYYTPGGWKQFFESYARDQQNYGNVSFGGTIKPWEV